MRPPSTDGGPLHGDDRHPLRGLVSAARQHEQHPEHRPTDDDEGGSDVGGPAHSNKEIAERLSIAPETVKKHACNAHRKLGVRNRVQLSDVVQNRAGRHGD